GPNGVAGKWTDAATGEHGDLLDIIRIRMGDVPFREVLAETRRFLALPPVVPIPAPRVAKPKAPSGSVEAAQRLFAVALPIVGTLAETYLRSRVITRIAGLDALRFHPRCYYRTGGATETRPAMIAAVTDNDGQITGVQRTWLARDSSAKAPLETPRRAMGRLLGGGVCFGVAGEVLAVGEGIETVLSVREAVPDLPVVAALSANHLAAFVWPQGLRRLYVLCDRDEAGERAGAVLARRAEAAEVEVVALSPRLRDFNEDLQADGGKRFASAFQSIIDEPVNDEVG
ncbi:MAG: toprim domain-containing protein, partial [Paracoccus sp. (in: a-proteobacteria)]|nr:toprim domain-containing protein [Paracoccus sp. (in: a-proteobacteria)]